MFIEPPPVKMDGTEKPPVTPSPPGWPPGAPPPGQPPGTRGMLSKKYDDPNPPQLPPDTWPGPN